MYPGQHRWIAKSAPGVAVAVDHLLPGNGSEVSAAVALMSRRAASPFGRTLNE
jgi:hypothetical protein